MTAEEHNKTLATLHFIYGAMHGLTLLGLLMLVFVVKFASPAGELVSASWMVIGGFGFFVLVFPVGVLPLLVRYGLTERKKWAQTLGIILAGTSLITLP